MSLRFRVKHQSNAVTVQPPGLLPGLRLYREPSIILKPVLPKLYLATPRHIWRRSTEVLGG